MWALPKAEEICIAVARPAGVHQAHNSCHASLQKRGRWAVWSHQPQRASSRETAPARRIVSACAAPMFPTFSEDCYFCMSPSWRPRSARDSGNPCLERVRLTLVLDFQCADHRRSKASAAKASIFSLRDSSCRWQSGALQVFRFAERFTCGCLQLSELIEKRLDEVWIEPHEG